MPKEFTQDSRAGHSSGIKAGIGVSVRWRKHGHAHGGSPLAIEPLVVTFDQPDSALDGIGAIIALDRAGCNRLIRSLRQARDDVYGKDA